MILRAVIFCVALCFAWIVLILYLIGLAIAALVVTNIAALAWAITNQWDWSWDHLWFLHNRPF